MSSNKTPDERFTEKVIVTDQASCWRWNAGKDQDGYGIFWANGKNLKAHRYSYEMHIGPIAPGLFVCHRCDNPQCTNPAHLFLGTVADNAADRQAKHRQPHGENHYAAKLTAQDVLAIRASKEPCRVLGARFNIDHRYVSTVRSGRKWKLVGAVA